MNQHRFASYEAYVTAQLAATHKKAGRTWVHLDEIMRVAGIVKRHVRRVRFGICHGVRQGVEAEVLRDVLGCDVIGTDLAPDIGTGIVRWDFHEPNPEWHGKASFVYSNALDHAYDPTKALRTWMETLAPGGVVLVHWSPDHNREKFGLKAADCYQASRAEYVSLAETAGQVVDLVCTHQKNDRWVLVLKPAHHTHLTAE